MSEVLSMVENARRATAPIVGIPIPGERPFCVRRDLLVSSLKGLRIIDAAIQLPLDGDRRNMRLEVYAVADKVKAIRRFAPVVHYTDNFIWAIKEREKRAQLAQPKVKTTARQKYIARLYKQLAKLGEPRVPAHPLLNPSHTTQYIRGHDARELDAVAHLLEEGSAISGPITYGDKWAAWKREAPLRGKIQSLARQCTKGKITTTQLYKTLMADGIRVKKYSELSTRGGKRGGYDGVTEYLSHLWENCNCHTKPDGVFDAEPEPTCGPALYEDWLEHLRERKELLSTIASLEQLENEEGESYVTDLAT